MLPVVAAEHVVSDYGTGAVMGVPWHDERDRAFASANNLPFGEPVLNADRTRVVNSGSFSNLSVSEARERFAEHLEKLGLGKRHSAFKLRDWLVSRQRPWGAPIPVIHCAKCGPVPVPEQDLPVGKRKKNCCSFHSLNQVPLAPRNNPDAFTVWKQCSCPSCGAVAERDTDTMDTFVDSSWYFLRYTDPHSTVRPCDPNEWMPVDTYIGGVEHAVLHLLYARFVNRFLHEIGWSPVAEPFSNLLTQGMVQSKTFRMVQGNRPVPESEVDAEKLVHRPSGGAVKVSWEKMSKSKLNGVDPQAMVKQLSKQLKKKHHL
jgi:leucyl-tRNA synthetase